MRGRTFRFIFWTIFIKRHQFASLQEDLQVTSICVYNTVRPPQQRQGTPPVQEVK